MTPVQLCKAIHDVFFFLPKEERESIQRCYGKTWSIVMLHHEGLISPKPASLDRLKELWGVVDRERNRQIGFKAERERQFREDIEMLQD